MWEAISSGVRPSRTVETAHRCPNGSTRTPYRSAAFGEWHLNTGRAARPGGPVRPLAERVGVDYFYGIPAAVEPAGSLSGGEPEDHRYARGIQTDELSRSVTEEETLWILERLVRVLARAL